MIKIRKRVLVDMSCSVLHHGHVRLLQKAAKYGKVIVGLTSDQDIKKYKKFNPVLNFLNRREILLSIKYVDEVIKSNFIITDKFLKKNNIDFLIHGGDSKNLVDKKKVKIFRRTKKISSSILRKKFRL